MPKKHMPITQSADTHEGLKDVAGILFSEAKSFTEFADDVKELFSVTKALNCVEAQLHETIHDITQRYPQISDTPDTSEDSFVSDFEIQNELQQVVWELIDQAFDENTEEHAA